MQGLTQHDLSSRILKMGGKMIFFYSSKIISPIYFLLWQYILKMKFTILALFNVQFSSITCLHTVVQPSPLSPEHFHFSKLKFCGH